MNRETGHKSLKDQNRWPLWLVIAVNWLVFYTIVQSGTFAISGIKALITDVSNILPAGLALIVTSVANGFLPVKWKERLVFLRWWYPLPGCRAFSKYAASDPRIDVARLKKAFGNKMPSGPDEENRAWYRLYKELEHDTAVLHVHREFLFTRDYAALTLLFILIFGGIAFYLHPDQITALYGAALLAQYVVVRQAAATYGVRFVCTVLARKSAAVPSRTATRTMPV